MSDSWVVSNHKFYKHPTLELAEAERARLYYKQPNNTFRIYRVKSHIERRNTYDSLISALIEIKQLSYPGDLIHTLALKALSDATNE